MVVVQRLLLQRFRYHEADHLCAIFKNLQTTKGEKMQSIFFHFIYCSYSRKFIRIFDAQLDHITYQVLLHVGDQAFLLLRLLFFPEPNLLYYIRMFHFGAPASSRRRSKIAAIFTTRYAFSGTNSSFNRVNHIKSYTSV